MSFIGRVEQLDLLDLLDIPDDDNYSINCIESKGYADMERRFVISRSSVRIRFPAFFIPNDLLVNLISGP